MTRRNRVTSLFILPSAAALLSLVLLGAPRLVAQQQPPQTTSACQIEMQTIVTPEQLVLGGSADVTLLMQHLCAENRRPVDLVFLVDTSNSMTRGGPARPGELTDPPGQGDPIVPVDPGKGDPPPPDPEPPGPVPPLSTGVSAVFDRAAGALQEPVPPVEPGDPPVKPPPPADPPAPGDPGTITQPGSNSSEPAGCIDGQGNSGGSGSAPPPGNAPISPPTPKVPPPGPGDPAPLPTRTPSPGGNIGGGSNSQPGTGDEPAGTEDLIRVAKQFIRDFVEQPRIERDMADGSLRIGLVAFSDRGRRLVSLTSEGQRIATRTNLLRGAGKTRIDLGLRTAERVLIDPNRRRTEPPDLRAKVIVVISDAAFCQKDLRVKVDTSIEVVTMLAGRSPWGRRMRDIATDNAFVLNLRPAGLPDLLKLYEHDFAQIRPVSMETLTIRGELQPDMELIEGSMNPAPAKREGQAMEWTWTPPMEAVTVTFKVKPLQPGFRRVDVDTTAAWTDTEALIGLEHFPAYYADVLGLEPTPTPGVEPTPTPGFAPAAP